MPEGTTLMPAASPEAAATGIRKLLAANRSEIAIRVFRSAHELGIRTVAIYAHEDRFALHRFKADEAYRVGKPGEPLRAYLGIEGILAVAREHEVNAIHPGYGFLSENADFAERVEKSGFQFIGPTPESIRIMGDKVSAKQAMIRAGVPCVPGSEGELPDDPVQIRRIAKAIGYPDVVSIANTAINQTGRAVECIAIVMLVYLTISIVTSLLMNWYNARAAIKER